MTSMPPGWALVSLGDLGVWRGGGTPSKSVPSYWTGDIPWVSPKDMKTPRIHDTADHISSKAVVESATKVVPAGSVLVVTRSGILAHSLPVAVTDREVAINQDLKALTPAEGIEPDFIAWVLRSTAATLLGECSKDGTTVSSIDMAKLLDFRVPIVPSREQRRIVAAIDQYLSRLDAGEASIEGTRLRATALRQQVLDLATPADAPLLPLGELLSTPLANGRSVPTAEGGFPVLRLSALRDGSVDVASSKPGAWTATDASPWLVHEGDFLIARGNGSLRLVGRGGLVEYSPPPVAFPDTMIRARVDNRKVRRRWLRLAWDSTGVRRQLESQARTTAGIYKINQQIIKRVRLAVPAPEDQERLVVQIERRLSVVNSTVEAMEIAGHRSASLRRAILERAFRGELAPQGPVDEPVSILLDRIRAECESMRGKARRRRAKA